MKYSIYFLIDKIENKTAMYTGYDSLSNLRSYLWGVCYVLSDLNIEVEEPDFYEFDAWIANKYGFTGSAPGWCNMIKAVSLGYEPRKRINWDEYDKGMSRDDDRKSLDLFFSLLREFRRQLLFS